jgi:hypothetical protein
MPYSAVVYNVMVASPSDLGEERKVARKTIIDWNNLHSWARQIVLLPKTWEFNTTPTMGERPQEIINQQVLKNADLLVGIFWTRIGTPTGKAISGTVEEINEHIGLGKPAMLYFSSRAPQELLDIEQLNGVKALKKEYQSKGLTYDFDSVENFQYQFQRHLAMKVNEAPFVGLEESILQFVPPELKGPQLSQAARVLLKEASLGPSGQIMKLGFISGFSIQANHKVLNQDTSAREKARWTAALEELLANELVREIGHKGEIFELTQRGFEFADTATI